MRKKKKDYKTVLELIEEGRIKPLPKNLQRVGRLRKVKIEIANPT